MTDPLCSLEKLLQTVNVQMWLCGGTGALAKLFVPAWAFQLLPSSPASLPRDCLPLLYSPEGRAGKFLSMQK